MLQINGKTFMNLQEAVQWLLDNNALPFQANVNFIANTEIARSAIINPSPTEIKVGSLVLFADSKVGTVSAVSSNSFMVGSEYTDIKTALAYIASVVVQANGHLIVTLSEGTTIDAGILKQVSSFSINASQHLIVNYNDGTSEDLGSIFNGNINISGTLNATYITGDSIIETMGATYGFTSDAPSASYTKQDIYISVCKNGNKVTFVIFTKINANTAISNERLGTFSIPASVGSNLYPTTIGGYDYLDVKKVECVDESLNVVEVLGYVQKYSNYTIAFGISGLSALSLNTNYFIRFEVTFLLSTNYAQ